MTIVEGQIEALAKLKESLVGSGVTRFNSIGEIRRFLSRFEAEKKQIPTQIDRELEVEIQQLKSALESRKRDYDVLVTNVRDDVEQQLLELSAEISQVTERRNQSLFFKAILFFKIVSLSRKESRLKRNLEKIVAKKTRSVGQAIAEIELELNNLNENKQSIAAERCENALKDLRHTKEVLDGLYPLVAGAVGEASVEKTLRKLSDEYFLINNFSMEFDPPIYNKKKNDRIYSVQIDHLLISKAGIFLLETKNWSKASVRSLDLRSPVEQIKRTSFALFVMLNSDSGTSDLRLKRHHWGAKTVPIRNIVVMINEKPKTDFKFVKVLSLDELLGYIQYFDEAFDGEEVKGIFEYLKNRI